MVADRDGPSESAERRAPLDGGGNRDPDALRRRAGVRGDPARDQHFLVDDRVLDRLPTYALDAGMDTGHLLEIGAGTGALTDRLLQIADQVTAVERDAKLAEFLRTEFDQAVAADRLTVVAGDALEVDLPAFSGSVSNLPYGASSQIAFRLLPAGRPMVLTFQREFADRLVADPGSSAYGRLSVAAGHYADVELLEPVPATAFDPPPAVDSAIVLTHPRTPEYEVPNDEFFLRFLKAVFTQRRKTLRNAIPNTAHISGLSDPDRVVAAAAEETLDRRAGALAPAEFAELAQLAWDVGAPAGA